MKYASWSKLKQTKITIYQIYTGAASKREKETIPSFHSTSPCHPKPVTLHYIPRSSTLPPALPSILSQRDQSSLYLPLTFSLSKPFVFTSRLTNAFRVKWSCLPWLLLAARFVSSSWASTHGGSRFWISAASSSTTSSSLFCTLHIHMVVCDFTVVFYVLREHITMLYITILHTNLNMHACM